MKIGWRNKMIENFKKQHKNFFEEEVEIIHQTEDTINNKENNTLNSEVDEIKECYSYLDNFPTKNKQNQEKVNYKNLIKDNKIKYIKNLFNFCKNENPHDSLEGLKTKLRVLLDKNYKNERSKEKKHKPIYFSATTRNHISPQNNESENKINSFKKKNFQKEINSENNFTKKLKNFEKLGNLLNNNLILEDNKNLRNIIFNSNKKNKSSLTIFETIHKAQKKISFERKNQKKHFYSNDFEIFLDQKSNNEKEMPKDWKSKSNLQEKSNKFELLPLKYYANTILGNNLLEYRKKKEIQKTITYKFK